MTAPISTPPAEVAFEVIPPLRRDLPAFGFENYEQYRHWCARHGLAEGLKQKQRERPSRWPQGHNRNQRPAPPLASDRRKFLEQIAAGSYPHPCWQSDIIEQSVGRDGAARQALWRLLLHVDRYMNVMQGKLFYPKAGADRRLLQGLLGLAHHHHCWLRPLEEWVCDPSISGQPPPTDQFSSLARHLLARYPVPHFMDIAFFEERNERGSTHQEWFIHIANGGSMRNLELPIKLTRRMAHALLNAPTHNRFNIEYNLRWAQVIGMGGDPLMARTILSTRLGRSFEDDEFWSSVVFFLVNNAMMDPGCVGPLVDYVYNMKFAPRRVVLEEGGVEEAPPPQPSFTMKGRSAAKLLRQVDAWHGHLSREENVVFQSWQPCGLRPYEMMEEVGGISPVRWMVQELQSSWELAAEGRAMSHCVVSYADQCADGKTAIWSICAQRQDRQMRENVLTVAVDIQGRAITQARGRHNMLPHRKPKSNREREEARSGYVTLLNRSAHVLQRWAERERLERAD